MGRELTRRAVVLDEHESCARVIGRTCGAQLHLSNYASGKPDTGFGTRSNVRTGAKVEGLRIDIFDIVANQRGARRKSMQGGFRHEPRGAGVRRRHADSETEARREPIAMQLWFSHGTSNDGEASNTASARLASLATPSVIRHAPAAKNSSRRMLSPALIDSIHTALVIRRSTSTFLFCRILNTPSIPRISLHREKEPFEAPSRSARTKRT